jgi:hypothetical protein
MTWFFRALCVCFLFFFLAFDPATLVIRGYLAFHGTLSFFFLLKNYSPPPPHYKIFSRASVKKLKMKSKRNLTKQTYTQ